MILTEDGYTSANQSSLVNLINKNRITHSRFCFVKRKIKLVISYFESQAKEQPKISLDRDDIHLSSATNMNKMKTSLELSLTSKPSKLK